MTKEKGDNQQHNCYSQLGSRRTSAYSIRMLGFGDLELFAPKHRFLCLYMDSQHLEQNMDL